MREQLQEQEEPIRVVVEVEGIVQGVGFRPTLQRLAQTAGLGGSAQNRAGSVRLVLTGPRVRVEEFLLTLPGRCPARARIERMSRREEAPALGQGGDAPFEILESEAEGGHRVSIPADLALCADCAREIHDPGSRFFGYAFTSCTHCGPRYTVVDGMPYDREQTTLRRFPLCPDCRAEYTDIQNRRFHAESIACPACGPKLGLFGADRLEQGFPSRFELIRQARRWLEDGRILAVRGMGGFQLAVDATNPGAIERLRKAKNRPCKPLAVMARDLALAQTVCRLTDSLGELLCGPERPILICELQPEAVFEGRLPLGLLSPDAPTLGVMLPTTPLHDLLFSPLPGDPTPPFDWLVMTSGNRGGEPICITNEEAFERLSGIAEGFLSHDREINLRCDDSLLAERDGAAQMWRRARGYVPERLRIASPLQRTVLAMGAEWKNTIALGQGDELVLSPHIGDLESPEAMDGLEQVVAHFPRYFQIEPEVVAVDRHPDIHASVLGKKLARSRGIALLEVQHHHAHARACMAEHGLAEALALVFDGTGLGLDGRIWGAELLAVNADGFRRLATFCPAPLPGGDAAVRHPARQLLARWLASGVRPHPAWLERLGVTEEELDCWTKQIERGLNTAWSHSAGRVFDSFSVLLGQAPRTIEMEGQPAIRLESLARRAQASRVPELPFALSTRGELLEVDWAPALAPFAGLDPAQLEAPAELALAFHWALARAGVEMVRHGRACCHGDLPVVLSGGVFMNRLLHQKLVQDLSATGVRVFVHRKIPPNDGGIAVGQAMIAGGGG